MEETLVITDLRRISAQLVEDVENQERQGQASDLNAAVEAITEALDMLSLARTALDDPGNIPAGIPAATWNEGVRRNYAVDRIDDAMRALGADAVAS